MNERIKLVRKAVGLTAEEFACRIGCTRGAISMYETGKRIPSNTVVTSICREFNIRYDWLTKGEGEMKDVPVEDDTSGALVKQYLTSPEPFKYWMRQLAHLDPAWRDKINEVLKKMDEMVRENERQ